MYISNNAANTYKIEMNLKEFQAFKKVFDRIIFNPDGVSNAFKLKEEDIQNVKSISGQLYVYEKMNISKLY